MLNHLIVFLFIFCLSSLVSAQQAIIQLENDDDVLPIASQRYDDAIELPKNNFSSVGSNDIWEKFERGELDQNAFIKLQEEYQAAASQSKDPYVKRKIATDRREKMMEARKKAQEERMAKIAEKKKEQKKLKETQFDREVELMAKEKEAAQKRAEMEARAQAKKEALAAKKAQMNSKKNRTPASTKKKPRKAPSKKK